MRTLIHLSEAFDSSLYGGKAVSLAKLSSHGFTVPSGFVTSGDTQNDFTDEFIAAILQQHSVLNAPYVAVRSSAVAEDGLTASWAGQLETYLNVTTEQLIEKIKLCQNSAHSARANAYAAQNKVSAGNTAVLVQEMVQPELSGVAFSTHPVTQDASAIVIEAVKGLGEALVSGMVTPDTYTTSKNSKTAQEVHHGYQKKKLAQNASGKTEWLDFKPSKLPNLSNEQITELATLVIELEQFSGFAVDVEWAYANGLFYVLQCRPITTID